MPHVLLASVGGSEASVIASLNQHQPEYVVFFASKTSRPTIREKIEPALTFRPKDHEIIVTPDEQDLLACTRILLDRLPEILGNWGLEARELVGDFTGGTKTMSAAVVLALSRQKCAYSYVGGARRDKDGLGVVINGSERVLRLDNPWDVLALDELKDYSQMFNRCQFQPAELLAARTAEALSEKREFFRTLSRLAKGYGLWDGFLHEQALPVLRQAESELARMATVGDERLRQCHAAVAENISSLAAVAAELERYVKVNKKKKAGPVQEPADEASGGEAIIRDLLANAVRRAEVEQRHEDAVARLYGAIEKIAKLRLKAAHGIDNSNVEPDRLPACPDWLTQCQDASGRVRLPLTKSFELLAHLGDPLGARFQHNRERLNDILQIRNNSLLAHGFTPVQPDTYAMLLTIALDFLAISRDQLPSFPVMRWGEPA